MKTLKDKLYKIKGINDLSCKERNIGRIIEKDVKETLQNFYDEYWKESKTMDKGKKHITCDDLDYLIDKHFGNIIDIKTLQFLPNQDKTK